MKLWINLPCRRWSPSSIKRLPSLCLTTIVASGAPGISITTALAEEAAASSLGAGLSAQATSSRAGKATSPKLEIRLNIIAP